MARTCGNCRHWDSAHSCTSPCPGWAARIVNPCLGHFIPAFTDATHCLCWVLKDSVKDGKGQCTGAPEGEKKEPDHA